MLSWVLFLPPPEAGKQCKSQNQLLSICLFLFFLPLLSFFSCATLTAKLWFHQRARLSLSCFLSAFRYLKKILKKALIILMTSDHVGQKSASRLVWHEYLKGCFSVAQTKCWTVCLLRPVNRRIKTSHMRLQLDSLFLMLGKLAWNRRLHFSFGKLVLTPFCLQAHIVWPVLPAQFSGSPTIQSSGQLLFPLFKVKSGRRASDQTVEALLQCVRGKGWRSCFPLVHRQERGLGKQPSECKHLHKKKGRGRIQKKI